MKKKITVLVLSVLVMVSIIACAQNINANTKLKKDKKQNNVEAIKKVQKDEVEIAKDNKDNMWVPKNIKKLCSISKPNRQLRDIIANYYEIPKEEYNTTRYYYNYVDLDSDGNDDIFVVVLGPYTSGSGGSSALWISNKNGKYQIEQAFTLVNTPVIVEGEKTQKKSLIMQRYGGGEKSQIVKLNLKGSKFENVSEAKEIKTLKNIKGQAIIAQDISEDVGNEKALTLDK